MVVVLTSWLVARATVPTAITSDVAVMSIVCSSTADLHLSSTRRRLPSTRLLQRRRRERRLPARSVSALRPSDRQESRQSARLPKLPRRLRRSARPRRLLRPRRLRRLARLLRPRRLRRTERPRRRLLPRPRLLRRRLLQTLRRSLRLRAPPRQ